MQHNQIIQEGFSIDTMCWINEPGQSKDNQSQLDKIQKENQLGLWYLSNDNKKLTLRPDGQTDFWRKTYYQPELISNNGHCFTKKLPANIPSTMEVDFTILPTSQFDQAGLIIYSDSQHWLKTGIEFVDGHPKLSCVITNTYSDWSTQQWSHLTLKIRVTQKGDGSYIVEVYSPDIQSNSLQFIRIGQLQININNDVYMGIYGCCPTAQTGCQIDFEHFSIVSGLKFSHTN